MDDDVEVFRSLPGDWRLSRTVGDQGSMTGVARFRQVEPAVLGYREEGDLRLATGAVLRAACEQRYALEPGGIRITFVRPGIPGRTLHLLRFALEASGTGAATASDAHRCEPDTYTGEYRVEGRNRVTIRMRVRGPSKDYVISTSLDRLT